MAYHFSHRTLAIWPSRIASRDGSLLVADDCAGMCSLLHIITHTIGVDPRRYAKVGKTVDLFVGIYGSEESAALRKNVETDYQTVGADCHVRSLLPLQPTDLDAFGSGWFCISYSNSGNLWGPKSHYEEDAVSSWSSVWGVINLIREFCPPSFRRFGFDEKL